MHLLFLVLGGFPGCLVAYVVGAGHQTAFFVSLAALFCAVFLHRMRAYAATTLATSLALWFAIGSAFFSLEASDLAPDPRNGLVGGRVIGLKHNAEGHRWITVYGWVGIEYMPTLRDVVVEVSVESPVGLHVNLGDHIEGYGIVRFPGPSMLPMQFDERRFCILRGIDLLAEIHAHSLRVRQRTAMKDYGAIARDAIDELVRKVFVVEYQGLVKGALFGDTQDLEFDKKRLYTAAGIGHILSVSGFHVALLAFCLLVLAKPVARRLWAMLVVQVVVWGYVYVCGSPPAALRAGAMFLLFQLALAMEREVSLLRVTSLSCIFFIVTSPELLADLGFQLSYAAVFAIGIALDLSKEWLRNARANSQTVIMALLRLVPAALAAWLATSYVLSYQGMDFNLLAPVVNTILMPVFSLGLIWAALAMASVWLPWVSQSFASSAELVFRLSDSFCRLTDRMPLNIHGDYGVASCCAVIAVLIGILSSKGSIKPTLSRASIISVALFLFWMCTKPSLQGVLTYRSASVSARFTAGDTVRITVADKYSTVRSVADKDLVRYLTKNFTHYTALYDGYVAGSSISKLARSVRRSEQPKSLRHVRTAAADTLMLNVSTPIQRH